MVNSTIRAITCIVARTKSTRLPKKVLKSVYGQSMIEHIIDRLAMTQDLQNIYIATSVSQEDKILCDIAKAKSINCYQGSEDAVIDRLLDIASIESADYIVRVTGDNIFTDPHLLDILIKKSKEVGADYARVEGAPLGVTPEVIRVEALKDCLSRVPRYLTEYLMFFLFDPSLYNTLVIDISEWTPKRSTLTVDTPEDWKRTEYIYDTLAPKNQPYLHEILHLNKISAIPFLSIKGDTPINTPKGKMKWLEFEKDMEARKNKSQFIINLTERDYVNGQN
ncbi:cytidylyltransferase domain-containing protein [Halorhodospira neutriphila]|uniref:Acylneuraminate cytidylyltransferase n=1 Tax=Halorhodospira neutriphila TaxID=168379 RepID=A0ABS1E3V2_9GAMM|nr:hypothetical protein [Halorhodospira neutriphila]MBK1725455.1 hypothetical protein [Halorhodospira neutriphila]